MKYSLIIKVLMDAINEANCYNNNTVRNSFGSGNSRIKKITKAPAPWDEECSLVINDRKEALKKAISGMTVEAWSEWSKCSAIVKKILREKKRKL